MIVVDTSALIAVVLGEPQATACEAALAKADRLLMSAGTLTESFIVSARLKVHDAMVRLIDDYGLEVVPLTPARARLAGRVYRRWGKGFHPADLKFGDCFAYALAMEHACPLLYIGNDFAQTDVASGL